jgi:plastocyanin
MRALALALVLAAAAPVVADAATTTVKVDDKYFQRAGGTSTVTVKRGDVVKWRFVGRLPHSVVSTDRRDAFRSSPRTSGIVKHRMSVAGTYRIYCGVHGPSMAMRLVVRR